MGKVPIWAQWLMVAAGVLLSPVFLLFAVWFMGWRQSQGPKDTRWYEQRLAAQTLNSRLCFL
jgi:hypothetical protein